MEHTGVLRLALGKRKLGGVHRVCTRQTGILRFRAVTSLCRSTALCSYWFWYKNKKPSPAQVCWKRLEI